MKIYALVVTYNRKELLCECLDALLNQSRTLDKIIVIDNASTDATEELFLKNGKYNNERIEYKRMTFNAGGSGGFYAGIKYICEKADWVWVMDDDTIPSSRALEELLQGLNSIKTNPISYLASKIVGPNGEPMNLPTIDFRTTENGYSDWYMQLDEGILKIRTATFVSVLINSSAIKKCGFPIPWYFIWGDDTEYTYRLTTEYGNAYFVGKSLVTHKRFNAKQLSVWTEENPSRIKIYYYFVRNQLYNKAKYEKKTSVIREILLYELKCIRCLFQKSQTYKFERITVVNKGILEFLLKKYDRQIEEKLVFEEAKENSEII